MSHLISFIIPTTSILRPRSLRHLLKKSWGLSDTMNSITRVVKVQFEIVVVCNSTDRDLISYLRSEKNIDKYCVINKNVGVSRAWNVGAMLAEGNLLCFINDDVELGKDSVEPLTDLLLSDDSVGEVGPAGGKFSGLTGTAGPRVGLDKIEEADEISGYMFILKRGVFDAVGGFDISYTPAGYEEIDMSFKIRSMGYRCLVVPNLNIIHHNYDGVSTKKNASINYLDKTITTHELHLRNKHIFISKWGDVRPK